MIRMNEYSITKIDDNNASVSFTVNSDLKFFEGHFDVQHLVPAFIQIDWVQSFVKEIFLIELSGNSPMIKFTSPMLPDDKVELLLKLNRDKGNVQFTYTLTDKKTQASSGKIKFYE